MDRKSRSGLALTQSLLQGYIQSRCLPGPRTAQGWPRRSPFQAHPRGFARASVCGYLGQSPPQVLPQGSTHGAAYNMAAGFHPHERETVSETDATVFCNLILGTDIPSLLMPFSLLKASHNLSIYVQSSIIHNGQKVKATQVFTNR